MRKVSKKEPYLFSILTNLFTNTQHTTHSKHTSTHIWIQGSVRAWA